MIYIVNIMCCCEISKCYRIYLCIEAKGCRVKGVARTNRAE